MKKVMNLLVKKKFKKNKKTIATLISLNRLKERGICTKSWFILPLSDNVLAPQAQFLQSIESLMR